MAIINSRFQVLASFALWAAVGLVFSLGAIPIFLHAQGTGPSATALRVAVAGSEPFVLDDESDIRGLSVDVWEAVASRLNLEFELFVAADIADALGLLTSRDADVVVGPVSITAERAGRVDFTQPYFNSSLAILAPPGGSLFDRFAPFISRTFIAGVVFLIAILLLVGTLIWIAERRFNREQFPESGFSGVGNGIWMALVTMTTVGYGDRVPVSLAGRVVTGIWMLVSLVIASSLTAFLATALTLSQMSGPAIRAAEDLRGARVGVVRGTTSEAFASQFGSRSVPFPDLAGAVDALGRGETDAVVFDRPILAYLLKQNTELRFRLSDASYQPQNYGFALQPDAPLTDSIGLAILELQGEGELRRIEEAWLGP